VRSLHGVLIVFQAACGRLAFDAVHDGALHDAAGDAVADDALADYATLVMASAPRAYFRLGEAAGSTARDSSGNGDDATTIVTGELAWGRAGALSRDSDTAVYLRGEGNAGDSSAASVEFASVSSAWAGDFTIELFVRPGPVLGGYRNALVVCENYLTSGFRTGWSASFVPVLWTTQAGSDGEAEASLALAPATWAHLVFVRGGTSVRIYINGALAGESIVNAIPPDSSATCGFGSFHGMPSDGELDEVAIYDRALGAAEIAAHVAAR
jgi:hypothetical protein